MTFSKENISKRLSRLPMLKVLAATLVGICVGGVVPLRLWLAVAVVVGVLVAAVLLRRKALSEIYLLGGVVLLAIASYSLRCESLPDAETHTYEIIIDHIADNGRGRLSGEGRVVGVLCDEEVSRRRLPVGVFADTTLSLAAGSRIVAECRISPYTEGSDNGYVRRMLREGFVGSVWLSEGSIVQCRQDSTAITSLRDMGLERISHLGLSADVEAVVAALVVGDKSRLTACQREDYRRSGASHLLAVSGLHVGFVFLAVSLVLWFLTLLPHGQILRSLSVVAIIWIYAAIVGFTPSVVRATVMFSLLQLSLLASSSARTLNSLCFAATVMLLWNPYTIYDVGFLLSCLSVAAIVEWGVPAITALRHKLGLYADNRHIVKHLACEAVVWLLSSVVVSVAASLATMPLVATIFGVTSLWGIILSPPLVLLCAVVVAVVVGWILLPIGALTPVIGWVVEWATSLMNDLTAWGASHPSLIFTEHLSAALCWGVYLAYIAFTILLWGLSPVRRGIPHRS